MPQPCIGSSVSVFRTSSSSVPCRRSDRSSGKAPPPFGGLEEDAMPSCRLSTGVVQTVMRAFLSYDESARPGGSAQPDLSPHVSHQLRRIVPDAVLEDEGDV